MCGLFGWYLKPGEFTLDEKGELAAELVRQSDQRGGDSWGIACPMNLTRYEIYKDVGRLGSHKMAEGLAAFDTLYGHTRARTSGAISRKNAHPFQVNHIIGAHNGTISNADQLNKKYKRNCQVDSQHIFYHLSENKPLDELEGWGAFWWFRRSQPAHLSLFKESYHSLSIYGIGTPEDTVGVIFASDQTAIVDALDAAGREGFPYQFNERLEYRISTWQGLTKTDRQMAFKSWSAWNTRQLATKSVRVAYKHLPRTARSRIFATITTTCVRCEHRYIFTVTTDKGPMCVACLARR